MVIHAAVVAFLFVLIFWVNRLPPGTVMAQGDFHQITNLNLNHLDNLFTWFQPSGQGQYNPLITTFPYYGVQWMLEGLGFSSSTVAQITTWGFLSISYLSMFAALGLLRTLIEDVPVRPKWRYLSSFVYALNPVTFSFFSASWGYEHQYLFYLFLPMILVLFIRLLIRFNWLDVARFVLISAIGTLGFNNLGFLNALAIFEGVIVATLMFTRLCKAGRTIAISAGLVITQIIVSLYVLMPFISSQSTYAAKAADAKAVGGNIQSFIDATSPAVYQVIGFEFDKYHFPGLNLLRPISLTNLLAKLIFLVPALLIVYMIIAIRRKSVVEKKIYVSFFILWIFTIVLCARVSPPFGSTMAILFKTPLLLLLRSPDKAIIFYPFFVFVPLYLGLQIWDLKGKIAFLATAILLFLPLPYYFGGITTYVSQGFASNLITKSDSGYKVAVTTPDPYNEAAARLNSTSGGGAIISVPFSSINSINWANYPAWNFVGADYLSQLFDRPYISADVPDHPTLETAMSFENFDQKDQSPSDFLNLVKKFNGQYILYHKDIDPSLAAGAGPTRHAIDVLENEGLLTLMMNNRYFDLYQVRNDEVMPLISSPWSGQYRKVSPVEYHVQLSDIGGPGNITFRQSENPSWGLYLNAFNKTHCKAVYRYTEPFVLSPVMNLAGPVALSPVMNECSPEKKLDLVGGLEYVVAPDSFSSSHRLVDDYANGWTIDPAYITSHFPKSYYHQDANGNIDISLTIYFKAQSYFYLGLVILGVVSLGSICLLVYELRSRKMRAGRGT